jgi:hypothetical protein
MYINLPVFAIFFLINFTTPTSFPKISIYGNHGSALFSKLDQKGSTVVFSVLNPASKLIHLSLYESPENLPLATHV